jgi:hypothetical protein
MMTKMMNSGGMMKSKMAAGGGVTKMGAVKTAAPSMDGVAAKGKTKGTQVKMAGGGMPMVEKGGRKVPVFAADGKGKMAGGGAVKKKMMKSGGY